LDKSAARPIMRSNEVAQPSQLLSLISLALIILGMVFNSISFAGESKPKIEKIMSQQLPPCPTAQNCVNSTDAESSHQIPALNFEGSSPEKAMQILNQVLLLLTEKVQMAEDGKTLHAEFKSAVLGFIDDVDVVLNADQKRIEIRSASRAGYYDFGVNRRRVESIRKTFDQALKQATD
jgi:uncharacterized protein (DUF1499 family)